jgi:hypothetical protein
VISTSHKSRLSRRWGELGEILAIFVLIELLLKLGIMLKKYGPIILIIILIWAAFTGKFSAGYG